MKTTQITIGRPRRPGWVVFGAALALLLTSILAVAQTPGVNVYPAVPGLAASDKYSVRVRAAANPLAWADAFTLQTKVPTPSVPNSSYYSTLEGWSHSYMNFEMTGPVTVEITKVGGAITSAAVHPERKAKNVYVSGGKAYLTMDNPCNVAVDIDGQMDSRHTANGVTSSIHTISIHANPVLENKPALNDPGVLTVTPGTLPPATGPWTTLYFLPGVHNLNKNFQVYVGKQYYIPGDAIVYGTFNNINNGEDGSNIRIFGHGTVSGVNFDHWTATGGTEADGQGSSPINIRNAKNSKLEGITIADPAFHSIHLDSWVADATITNVVSWVKTFTWRANGDGGGAGANNEVTNCFMRTQDDGIYLDGRRVSGNVLWTDANGLPMRLSFLPNSTFVTDNIDVIYSRSLHWHPTNAMGLPADATGDHGAGVVFSNIVVSDKFPDAPAISINQSAPGSFSGTRFENWSIASPKKNKLIAATGASIHDLTFDNLVIGGVLVTPSNWQNYFTTSGNVYNIFFTSSGVTPPDALPRTDWVAKASASHGASPASFAIDGIGSNRWSTGAKQANGQWFKVDLGSAKTFSRIAMDAGLSTNDYPRAYQVHVSNNDADWGSAVATGAGTSAVVTSTFATQTARYIRVTQTGTAPANWWSIADFHVYMPAVFNLPTTGWVATASASGGGIPADAIDENVTTRWSPGVNQANGQWFQVDLGSAQTFSQIVLDAGPAIVDYARGYEIHVSSDALSWGSPIKVGTGSSAQITIDFAIQTARYIRVTQTGSSPANWWGISEFEVNLNASPNPIAHTLAKSSSNGKVAVNPAWPTYPTGTVVNVTAVPNPGYVFSSWGGGLTGSTNPTTLTMDANKSVTANFTASAATYTLTAASPNGTVTFSPAGPTYPVNTVVTVTAVPSAGYSFTGWSGALSGLANPTTITMNGNKSITANIIFPALPRNGWVASASASGESPANAIDGSITTRWATGAEQANGQWFQVDMGAPKDFSRIVIDAGPSVNDYPRGYQVFVSNNGVNWGGAVVSGSGSAVTTIDFPAQTARYIRVTQTGSAAGIWWSIHEFNVYGLAFHSPWQAADVGTVAAAGSASYSNPTWTIVGSGADIAGVADAFRFVYQSSTGDCSHVARVASVTNTDPGAKSGLMIRESTAANSINAMMCVTPGNGVRFQWRGTTGGNTSFSEVLGQTAPKWLRITRTGNSFAGSYSSNGTDWISVGTPRTITMTTGAKIGVCVTSRVNGTLCTSTMDSVTLTP
jgi:hypothetical protein